MMQGTDEWLNWRKLGMGASDSPIIMNASPWKTRLELFHEKVSGKSRDISHFPHVMRGHLLEDKAREWAEERLGETYLPTCLVHPEHSEIRASFDGLNLDHTSCIEIKCPGAIDHKSACDGQIPEKYLWQLRHLMLVADVDEIHYISFDGSEGVLLTLKRCKELEKRLVEALLSFWQCVQRQEPPDYTERDFVPMLDEEWKKTAHLYLDVVMQMKQLEEKRERAKQRLIEMAGSHQRVRGYGLQLSQTTRAGTIDYKKIPELKEVDLDRYRRAGTSLVTIREVDAENTFS